MLWQKLFRRRADRQRETPVIGLALQGGGAHGAFTWGVLDRLFEEPELDIGAISGTSAGAMNGAMAVCGYARGGRIGAKALMRQFWESVGEIGAIFSPFEAPLDKIRDGLGMQGAGFFDMITHFWSPYQFNPLNLNPLRDILERLLDIEALHACTAMDLFVTATNVQTGHPRVFSCKELSIDALMASACLPFLYQAVEIDGVPYWDGGYAGNPALWPLIYTPRVHDILLVQINPIYRESIPSNPKEILNRVNEITFNAALISELRAIEFVDRLLDEHRIDRQRYRRMFMHRVDMQSAMSELGPPRKLSLDTAFFHDLHARGRTAADIWLQENKVHIGVRSSVDIGATFLRPRSPDHPAPPA